jgi:cell division protein FtsA
VSEVFVGLDISSSKIVCLIAQSDEQGGFCLKGASLYESKGIRNGNIISSKLAIQSIVRAVSRAEKMYGDNIENVSVSIAGDLLKSKILKTKLDVSSGKAITRKNIVATSGEIVNRLQSEKKNALHLVPIEFTVDNVKTENPIGIVGRNVEAKFNVFFADNSKIENLSSCFKSINLVVDNVIFEGFASALAVLTGEEKKSGTLVLDIGAGTTSFAIIKNDRFVFGASLPMGGDNITGDLANILDIPFPIAEKIKIMNTNLFFDRMEENELIKLDIEDEETFRVASNRKKIINDVFRSRISEIVNLVLIIIDKKELAGEFGSIVITGGVASALGLDGFIAKIANIKTRIGTPEGFSVSHGVYEAEIKKPMYATAIGILNFISYFSGEEKVEDYRKGMGGVIDRVINFLTGLFTS